MIFLCVVIDTIPKFGISKLLLGNSYILQILVIKRTIYLQIILLYDQHQINAVENCVLVHSHIPWRSYISQFHTISSYNLHMYVPPTTILKACLVFQEIVLHEYF